MLMKKHGYREFKSNNFFLRYRGGPTILSNICNKSFGNTVDGVWRDFNVHDQSNEEHTLNSHV